MPIAKKKFPKTSIKHHVAMPNAEQASMKELSVRSAAQLAYEVMRRDDQNLRRNVGEHTESLTH